MTSQISLVECICPWETHRGLDKQLILIKLLTHCKRSIKLNKKRKKTSKMKMKNFSNSLKNLKRGQFGNRKVLVEWTRQIYQTQTKIICSGGKMIKLGSQIKKSTSLDSMKQSKKKRKLKKMKLALLSISNLCLNLYC